MDIVFIKQLVVSLGLGLLVGFQREWGPPHVAGIRSFALIAVLGTICARLGITYGGWIISAGLIAVTALVIAGGIAKYYSNELTPGITTGAAALLIYAVGALVVDHISEAIIVGGVTAVLLHWKKPLHALVKKASEMDAITLSTTQLLKQQRIDIETGWRMIIIGALSNLVFKGAIAAALGNRQLTRHIGVYFGLGIIGGACMIAF